MPNEPLTIIDHTQAAEERAGSFGTLFSPFDPQDIPVLYVLLILVRAGTLQVLVSVSAGQTACQRSQLNGPRHPRRIIVPPLPPSAPLLSVGTIVA